jgi:hypothetical protein
MEEQPVLTEELRSFLTDKCKLKDPILQKIVSKLEENWVLDIETLLNFDKNDL